MAASRAREGEQMGSNTTKQKLGHGWSLLTLSSDCTHHALIAERAILLASQGGEGDQAPYQVDALQAAAIAFAHTWIAGLSRRIASSRNLRRSCCTRHLRKDGPVINLHTCSAPPSLRLPTQKGLCDPSLAYGNSHIAR
eukprot:3198838-Pleurochrysis_carterae.AAC.2